MNQLIIRLGNQTKKVSIPRTNSSEDLGRIIQSIFKTKEKIVGVTDQHGKFYDLQFVNDNLKLLKAHQLDLVTVKDTNEQNMSFASDNIDNLPNKKQDITNETQLFQKTTQGFLGYIMDLPFFQELLLQEKKLIIVVCSSKDKNNLKIPYTFYLFESQNDSVIIYYDRKKIGQLFIQDWKNLENKIDAIVKNLNQFQKSNKNQNGQVQKKKQQDDSFSDLSNKSLNVQNQVAVEEIKNTFLENIAKLRDEQTISQLEYYKLKAKLFQNPQDFMRKYQMGTRQGFRKRKSIDQLRDEIVRSKQQKSRYQTIINQFRDVRQLQPEQNYNRNFKNQIPIIVRKYNNVIQKISTSYPLNLQQEQAINLIMQLQLKGLISEADARDYKSQILQEEPVIFALFSEYFKDSIDQIQLARKLKNKKKNDKKSLQQKNRSEEIVRMIIKYAKRNSFQLLRNLAIEGNNYVFKCYEQYLKDKNAQAFASSLQKVASYYKAKSKLEDDFENV